MTINDFDLETFVAYRRLLDMTSGIVCKEKFYEAAKAFVDAYENNERVQVRTKIPVRFGEPAKNFWSKTMTEFRKIASLRYQYEISEDGKILRNIFTRRPRKFYMNDNGYLCVNVQSGSLKKTVYVAALVAECWLGIKPLGFQIDHIDHDKHNNHYQNLRYVSPSENVRNSPSRKHNPVVLTNSKGTWHFKTMAAAARFISKKKQKTVRCCMRKFNGRKEEIFGYTVTYHFKRISVPQPRPKVIQLSLFEDYEFVTGRLIYRQELNA